jgi:hypothetical protein
VSDVLDEDRWQLFALASASKGVRSSLSLPLRHSGAVYGSINFYAGTEYAFVGRERDLAVMFGAVVQEAVANADLSMSSIDRARQAPKTLHDLERINMAVGLLTEQMHVPTRDAYARLVDAARRAGVSALALAELVLREHQRRRA